LTRTSKADLPEPSECVATVWPATRRAIRLVGELYFWQGGSLWIGTGSGRTALHAHHAHHIALSLGRPVRICMDPPARPAEVMGAFVPSKLRHECEFDGPLVHIFIEPESAEGHALARRFGATAIQSLPTAHALDLSLDLTTALQQCGAGAAMVEVCKAMVGRLAGLDTVVRPPLDPRLATSIEYLRGSIRNGTSLKEAAAVARLSPSRYRHLFVAQTGTSFRAYVLWLRLNMAVQSATEGHSWTTCAHEAGFADSSHLTRTFKRMFGINPASLVLK